MIEKVTMLEMYLKNELKKEDLISKGFIQNRKLFKITKDELEITYLLKLGTLPFISIHFPSESMRICDLEEFELSKAISVLNEIGLDEYIEIVFYGQKDISNRLLKSGFSETGFFNQLEHADINSVYNYRGDYYDWCVSVPDKLSNVFKSL